MVRSFIATTVALSVFVGAGGQADPLPQPTRPYLTVRLHGELGNQLFQIAAAYAHAHHLGWAYFVPDLVQSGHLNNIAANYLRFFQRVPADLCRREGTYREPNWLRYQALPAWQGMVLDGYFQSEKYFEAYRDEIRDLFAFREGHWDRLTALYPQLLEANKIAVQIRVNYDRRNDTPSFHPTFGQEYFGKAMATFPEEALFVVMSNHIGVAQQILSGIDRRILFLEETDRFDDLLVMSRCEHLIGSNSTLAWWGAWLGDRPGRRCIFPFPWVRTAPTRADAPDLLPARWEVLECPDAVIQHDPTIGWTNGFKR